jgi:hypothetical protein
MRDLFMILTVAAIYTLALGSAIVTRTYWHLGRWLAWPHRFLLARWLLWSALFGSLVGLEFARHAYWGFRGSLEGGGQASWRASLWILPLALAAFLEARRASRAVLKVAWDKSCDCLRKIFPTAEVASLAEDLRELGFPGAGQD